MPSERGRVTFGEEVVPVSDDVSNAALANPYRSCSGDYPVVRARPGGRTAGRVLAVGVLTAGLGSLATGVASADDTGADTGSGDAEVELGSRSLPSDSRLWSPELSWMRPATSTTERSEPISNPFDGAAPDVSEPVHSESDGGSTWRQGEPPHPGGLDVMELEPAEPRDSGAGTGDRPSAGGDPSGGAALDFEGVLSRRGVAPPAGEDTPAATRDSHTGDQAASNPFRTFAETPSTDGVPALPNADGVIVAQNPYNYLGEWLGQPNNILGQVYIPRLSSRQPTVRAPENLTADDRATLNATMMTLRSHTTVAPRWWRAGDGIPHITIRYNEWPVLRDLGAMGGLCSLWVNPTTCRSTNVWLPAPGRHRWDDRTKMINHEFGHGLGLHHTTDPESVMMQGWTEDASPVFSAEDLRRIDERYEDRVPAPRPGPPRPD